MKIEVIGCSGAEMPGHNAPAFLLDNEILFDAGSLTGVLNEKAQLRIKNIFITHAHLDHIRSIPFLADNIVVGKNNSKVNIFSISPVIRTIKKHLFNSAVWPDFTIIPNPQNAILNLVELRAGQSITINGHTVIPYKVSHTVPAVGYLIEDEKGRRIFYTGDTGPSPNTWKKLTNKEIHCLIIDVSFPNRMKELALRTAHLTPDLLKRELANIQPPPGCIFITHPKPQYVKTIKREIDGLKLGNIRILKDGDTIRV
jgi:cAMP phosphodiesterase